MKIYALNGFLYPLPIENVDHVWRWNWSDRNAEQFARTIKEECILIGFSAGAKAALTVAQNSKFVKRVYCHSCLYSSYPLKRKFDVSFFITKDDKLIKDGTDRTFLRYQCNGYNCSIMDLDAQPIPGYNPVHIFMNKNNHHFENCLEYLPKQINNT